MQSFKTLNFTWIRQLSLQYAPVRNSKNTRPLLNPFLFVPKVFILTHLPSYWIATTHQKVTKHGEKVCHRLQNAQWGHRRSRTFSGIRPVMENNLRMSQVEEKQQ